VSAERAHRDYKYHETAGYFRLGRLTHWPSARRLSPGGSSARNKRQHHNLHRCILAKRILMVRTSTRTAQPLLTVFRLSLVVVLSITAGGWGRRAHQMVNAAAIKTLPAPLRPYFLAHQFYLVDHASDPDLKARHDARERPRHFTEVDAYGHYPFLEFRREFVVERRGPSPAQIRHGTVMWQIERFTRFLEQDFRRGDWREANYDSVYLAHYAADLTQPLHVVSNYDGQQTGQRGIHERFEVGLVDLMADRWFLHPRPAVKILNLRARIFEELLNSYRQSQGIFAADQRVRASFAYTSPRFLPAFAAYAGPVAKGQLEDAASFAGSLWYTAWVRAGKPDLGAWKQKLPSGGIILPRSSLRAQWRGQRAAE
jgi:hypothetical protein